MSWEMVRLEEILDLQNGFAFDSKDYVESSDVYNCRMSNIRPGGDFDLDYNPRFLPDDFAVKYSQFLLKEGDIIVAMTDLANDPKILGVPTIVNSNRKILLNQRVGKLIIKDRERVFIPFLKYALNRKEVQKYFAKFSGGGLQINLGKNDLLSYTLNLPPLPIQKRIAEILDAADALKRKDQELLKKYDELAQAIFIDMFGDPVKNEKGWEYVFLKDLSIKITDGTHLSPKFTSSGIPFLFVSNIVDNQIDYRTDTFISKEEFENLNKRTPIEIGNILLTTVGSYGNPAIIEKNDDFAFQRHIAFIKPNHELVNYVYLYGFLQSPFAKLQIDKKVNGVAQKTLNLSDLKELKVWNVPRKLQDEYAQRMKVLKSQIQIITKVHSDILFQTLIQKAFKGELVE